MYILYDLIFLLFLLLYFPYFLLKKKFHKDIWQRLGFYPEEIKAAFGFQDPPIGPIIWIHAVSVGEVAAVKELWRKLREEFFSGRIIVTTVTRTGNDLAKKFASGRDIVTYLPLDISFVVGRFLEMIKPDILIIAETEVWPNLISACYDRKAPVIIVNGRISKKAFKRYKITGFALGAILKKINLICAQTAQDRDRFAALGAAPGNLKVSGNMKYCNAAPSQIKEADIRKRLSVESGSLIFTAGSTHTGEDEIILGVFKRLKPDFKNLRLIIAPRHVERAGEIKRLAKGLNVAVIDKIGILQDAYSISDIVFVGGSLVKKGGHNIIEPAVFGKPIIFGPHMFNFQDVAGEFLKNDAAVEVASEAQLEISCRRLLSDAGERLRLGENAKRVVLENQGAVSSCFSEIKRILCHV